MKSAMGLLCMQYFIILKPLPPYWKMYWKCSLGCIYLKESPYYNRNIQVNFLSQQPPQLNDPIYLHCNWNAPVYLPLEEVLEIEKSFYISLKSY